MARVIYNFQLGFRGTRFGHLGSLDALIEFEEKKEEEKEELGQVNRKEEEGLNWELRRRSRKLVGRILHLRYGFYTHLSLFSVLI